MGNRPVGRRERARRRADRPTTDPTAVRDAAARRKAKRTTADAAVARLAVARRGGDTVTAARQQRCRGGAAGVRPGTIAHITFC